MPKRRRRKSSEDKKASDDSSTNDNSGKGVNGDMRERCEDLIRRIRNGDERARSSYSTILSDIETKLMAELDSDTLDTMVRLFIYFCHSIVGLYISLLLQKLEALKRESKTKKALLIKHEKELGKWIKTLESLSSDS